MPEPRTLSPRGLARQAVRVAAHRVGRRPEPPADNLLRGTSKGVLETPTSLVIDALGVRPAITVLGSHGSMASDMRASSWLTASRAIHAKSSIGDA